MQRLVSQKAPSRLHFGPERLMLMQILRGPLLLPGLCLEGVSL
jgi:hypothetical protein